MKKTEINVSVVETQTLILKDKKGEVKGIFDADGPSGYATLDLLGPGGVSIALTIDTDGNPKLSIGAPSGKNSIAIGISNERGSGITLYDSEGKIRLMLSGHENLPSMIDLNTRPTK